MSPLPQPDIQDEQLLDNLNSIDRRIGDVQAALRRRISALEAAPTWTAPTLLNSWVNYGTGGNAAGYWKDASGWVHLRGLVKSGTPGASSVIFTLPSGSRPTTDDHFFATASNAAYGTCWIQLDGDVIAASGSGTWFSRRGRSG